MSWFNFYKNRVNSSYLEYAEKRYKPMIDKIIEFIPECGRAVEAGCGIGTISKIIASKKKCVILGFDNCEDMLKLADTNITCSDFFYNENGSTVWLKQDDILTYTGPAIHDSLDSDVRVDVVFSHGVLEHFNDAEINTIISNQKQYAKHIVHYVPGDKYKVPSFGDERLMCSGQWKEICNPSEIITFNDGFDYLLIW
jgi:2-polyprenyl-3-methyl-5-hydroxy-6-metoxy-1,4-benzoquinol methylase